MIANIPKCYQIHKTIVEQFKHAIVYGRSVKHQPQRVGLGHELADEDISKLKHPSHEGEKNKQYDLSYSNINPLPSTLVTIVKR